VRAWGGYIAQFRREKAFDPQRDHLCHLHFQEKDYMIKAEAEEVGTTAGRGERNVPPRRNLSLVPPAVPTLLNPIIISKKVRGRSLWGSVPTTGNSEWGL
jgi:hypothetical protein